MVSFQLVYTQRALQDIEKLDRVVKKRLGNKLKTFAEAPLIYGKKINSSDFESHRFRIGDYLVIFDIDGRKIIVLRVGHRRDIYR